MTRVCVATGTPRGLAPHPATVQTSPTAAAIAAARLGFVALWRLLPTLDDHIEAPAAHKYGPPCVLWIGHKRGDPGWRGGAETIRASAPPSSSRSVNDLRVLRSRTAAKVPTDAAGSLAPPTLDLPAAVRAVRHPVGEVDLEQQPLGRVHLVPVAVARYGPRSERTARATIAARTACATSPLSPRQLRQRRCCSGSQPARSGSREPRRPRL